jgi:hypothetical protein
MPQRKEAPDPASIDAAAGTPAQLLFPLNMAPAMAPTVDVAIKPADAKHCAAKRAPVILQAGSIGFLILRSYSAAAFRARPSKRFPRSADAAMGS